MIKRYNTISLLLGVPGLIMQFAGPLWVIKDPRSSLACVLPFLGATLLILGLGYYAKSKGRSWNWGWFGLLGIIGFVVLACLRDDTLLKGHKPGLCLNCGKENPETARVCEGCNFTLIEEPSPMDPKAPRLVTSRLAVWSLVLGITSLLMAFVTGIPAIICGHIALSKIHKSKNGPEVILVGRKKAIAGLILGYAFSILHGINIILGIRGNR
jgi:hypothetical protein